MSHQGTCATPQSNIMIDCCKLAEEFKSSEKRESVCADNSKMMQLDQCLKMTDDAGLHRDIFQAKTGCK